MPLPADGAVSGYEFRVGDRTVTGRVEPKAQARERFEQAIVAGKTAGLLEQQRADIFTQEIGNIPSRTAIVARITVDLRLAWLPEGEWELRFPTVIGPRYVGASDPPETAAAVRIAVAERTDARLHLELRVRDEVTRGRTVESPSHRLAAGFEPGDYTLATRTGERLDRDLVVRWSVAQQDVGVALSVARPAAGAAHATCAYGLLTLVPPAPEAGQDSFPRDLIVLLDTSGSMDGAPLAQAQKVVAAILDSLGERDRIEVIEFSGSPRPWRSQPVAATREARADAIRWVRALRAGGATEMHTAVMSALRSLRPHAQRQVVLVTDGYIGGEQQIVDLCHERLPAGCRLHVVGVGSAVNRSLATALSRAGRGAEVLVGLDEDVERPARRLLDRTIAPVLTDLVLGGDALIEMAPEHLPDVFTGAPLRAAVKLAPGGGELIVRGNLAHGTWERRLLIPATRPGTGAPGIVALYAREHVADLETRWTIGREAQQIDKTIEKLGVVFQISTRHTSWIAIDDEVRVDPARGSLHETQPQELPAGTSITSFGLASEAPPVAASPVFRGVSALSPGPAPASQQRRSALTTTPKTPEAPAASSRNAKTVIHTGSKKPVPLDPERGLEAPPPQAPSGPTKRADSSNEAPTTPPIAPQERGFFSMPAARPLRSRETLIGNLMTMDSDTDAPVPAKDDAVREAYYQEVFAEFVKFKVANNESIETFTYEKFATKLRVNTAELMRRPGVTDVQFSVYLKDGKVALKARVVRDPAKADNPAPPAAAPESAAQANPAEPPSTETPASDRSDRWSYVKLVAVPGEPTAPPEPSPTPSVSAPREVAPSEASGGYKYMLLALLSMIAVIALTLYLLG